MPQKARAAKTDWPTKGQLFEIQGSKFKPHPSGNSCQTSAVCKKHPMLVFGVGKDPLNGLFARSVDIHVALRLAQLLRQIWVVRIRCPFVLAPQASQQGQFWQSFCVLR